MLDALVKRCGENVHWDEFVTELDFVPFDPIYSF